MTFSGWLWGFAKRFLAFFALTIAVVKGFSWAFGYDAEVTEWAIHNRPLTATFIVLCAIVFAMYDWLQEPHR